jgi:phosphoesterase family protein/carboxypeptidase family protein
MKSDNIRRTRGSTSRRAESAGLRLIALCLTSALLVLSPVVRPIGSAGPSHLQGVSGVSGIPAAAPVPASTFPTPINHVFVLFLENQDLSSVNKSGPFELYLAKKYASATSYYSPCHPSAPNYIAVTSGLTLQCGSDGVSNYSEENIGDLAQTSGLSWGGFMESMPSACDTSDSYPYMAHHNPFVYYADIRQNTSLCKSHDQSFAAWNNDVSAGTIPNYAFFAPNMTNDGHDTGTAYADSWLKGWLSPYLNDSWFSTSVWFITWDEGTSSSGCCGFSGGQLFFAAVSPYSQGGLTFSNDSTHYSLLSTTEWLLGLTVGGCGNNDNLSKWAPMKSLFNFSSLPPTPHYIVSGTVSSNATGLPIANATVSSRYGPTTRTNASGGYSLSLANGTYVLTASGPSYASLSATVTVQGAPVVQNFVLVAGAGIQYPITGTVTYALNGTVAVGATVGLAGGIPTTTGPGGTYGLLAQNGTYTLEVWQAGYRAEQVSITVAGGPVLQNIALHRFMWPTTGTVVDAVSGRPLAGATVTVTAGPTVTVPSNVTDAAGTYTLFMANGTYTLSVSSSGYRSTNVTQTIQGLPSSRTVPLSPIAPLFSVSGKVTYQSNGSPAAGITVALTATLSVVTASDGGFQLWTINGSYTIRVHAPGWQPIFQVVQVAGAALYLPFALLPFVYLVSGHVLYVNGTPAVGALVLVTPGNVSALTGSDGSFAFQLANGTYVLNVSGAAFVPQAATVVLLGGGANQSFVVSPRASASQPPPTPTAPNVLLSWLANPWIDWLLLFGLVGGIIGGAAAAYRRSRRSSYEMSRPTQRRR